jgi:hypothetical protein
MPAVAAKVLPPGWTQTGMLATCSLTHDQTVPPDPIGRTVTVAAVHALADHPPILGRFAIGALPLTGREQLAVAAAAERAGTLHGDQVTATVTLLVVIALPPRPPRQQPLAAAELAIQVCASLLVGLPGRLPWASEVEIATLPVPADRHHQAVAACPDGLYLLDLDDPGTHDAGGTGGAGGAVR